MKKGRHYRDSEEEGRKEGRKEETSTNLALHAVGAYPLRWRLHHIIRSFQTHVP